MKRLAVFCLCVAALATVSLARPSLDDQAQSARLTDAMRAYEAGDYARAQNLFRVMALNGSPAAETMLGVMTRDGLGVPRDAQAAAMWFYKAALKGYPQGQLAFGALRASGRGVMANPQDAYVWLRLAQSAGDAVIAAEAARLSSGLRRTLSSGQTQEAEARVRTWRPMVATTW
jgi:uncharacterized protein